MATRLPRRLDRIIEFWSSHSEQQLIERDAVGSPYVPFGEHQKERVMSIMTPAIQNKEKVHAACSFINAMTVSLKNRNRR
jgi:hypothetical protein